MLPIPFNFFVESISATSSPQSYTSSTWVSSWGPTPSVWYDASMSDFTTNKVNPSTARLTNTSGATPSFLTYSNTLNSLPVVNATTSGTLISLDTTGSYYTTHFVVGYYVSSASDIYYSYSSLGNTQSNRGQFVAQTTTGLTNLVVNSRWSSDVTSATYQTVKSFTFTPSTWYVSVLTSTHSGSGMYAPSQLFNDSKYNGSSGTPYYTFSVGMASMPAISTLADKSYQYITFASSTNGKYGEIITYYSRISAAEISQVETYLKAKWGITY